MGYFQVRYDSRVVIYDHRAFKRLATGPDLITKIFVTPGLSIPIGCKFWHNQFERFKFSVNLCWDVLYRIGQQLHSLFNSSNKMHRFIETSGQSYKHFTIVNYDSRFVIWANL